MNVKGRWGSKRLVGIWRRTTRRRAECDRVERAIERHERQGARRMIRAEQQENAT